MINQPWKHAPKRSIKEQALLYAQQRYWYVFPSPPGGEKMGLVSADTSNGNRWGSTASAEEIESYFTRWPNANIGIATGVLSKIFVLDVDTLQGHGVDGIANLKKLQTEHGILPVTLIAKSPTGSLHYYFNYPAEQAVRMRAKLLDGIDIKGEGGMVIAPPSIRPGAGEYVWINDNAVADAPGWLLDLIVEPESSRSRPDTADFDPEADLVELRLAMAAIPHSDDTWSTWNRIGMALWRASGGQAFELFDAWSKQWHGYNARNTRQRWKSFERSRPTELGAGTIFYLAHLANPDWRQLDTPENEAQIAEILNGYVVSKRKGRGSEQINRISQTKTSIIVCAADLKPEPKHWLWYGHLLRGSQELMTGLPMLGKSQVQISFIASLTAGLPWPDGTKPMALMDVVMLTAEDNLTQEVIPRLMAAGADLKRVHIFKAIRYQSRDRQFQLDIDLDELERKVTSELTNVGLVTIDPITAYMGGKVDSHKATEVRSQLGPLKDFAERTNIAVSTITHPPKASNSPRALDQFIGSQAFIAAGRIGHVCAPEMDDGDDGERTETGRYLFTHAKHNASEKLCSWAYEIVRVEISPGVVVPKVVWSPEEIHVTADEAVASANNLDNVSNRKKRTVELENLINGLLRDGPMAMSKVLQMAEGIGYSRRQVQLAKERLAIRSEKNGFQGEWTWELNSTRLKTR